jgi:hypothetical protein
VHANEEMSNDELTSTDVENVILTGKIVKRLSRDPRGIRYEIVGQSCDARQVGVVSRMIEGGWLRIITVYALDETNNETRNM